MINEFFAISDDYIAGCSRVLTVTDGPRSEWHTKLTVWLYSGGLYTIAKQPPVDQIDNAEGWLSAAAESLRHVEAAIRDLVMVRDNVEKNKSNLETQFLLSSKETFGAMAGPINNMKNFFFDKFNDNDIPGTDNP